MSSGSDEKNYVAACFAIEGIEWWGIVWWACGQRKCRRDERAFDDEHGPGEYIKAETWALRRFDSGKLHIATVATWIACSWNLVTGPAFVGSFHVEVSIGAEAEK